VSVRDYFCEYNSESVSSFLLVECIQVCLVCLCGWTCLCVCEGESVSAFFVCVIMCE